MLFIDLGYYRGCYGDRYGGSCGGYYRGSYCLT